MADNDRMVFRRASDQKWIDKRNGASRGFAHDTQADAAASAPLCWGRSQSRGATSTCTRRVERFAFVKMMPFTGETSP